MDSIWPEDDPPCYQDCASYFCWSVAPKLKEIPEFNNLPEPVADPCQSCIKQWENAVITILSWADDGTTNVSKEFEDFYNGLLYFRNVHDCLGTMQEYLPKLLNFTFEVYGSDPSGLPKLVGEIFKIWESVPKDVWRDFQPDFSDLSAFESVSLKGGKYTITIDHRVVDSARWGQTYRNIIEHKNSSGSLGVGALGHYLHRGLSDLRRKVEGSRFNGVKAFCDKLGSFRNNPFMEGFESCASVALELCRKKHLTTEHEENVAQFHSMVLSEDVPTEVKIRLYVGPSGCGKTHKLHELLREQWGVYLLPGNLPLQSGSNSSRLLRDQALSDELSCHARRSGGSRDTQTLYHDVKAVKAMNQELSFQSLARSRLQILFEVRLSVLEDFLRVYPERRTPADWLYFQTSSEDASRDVFNHLFRIARFHSTYLPPRFCWAANQDEEWKKRMSARLPSNLLICIDEAQCDLEEKFLDRYGQPFSLLGCTVYEAAWTFLRFINPRNFHLCVSGTALQVWPTLEELNMHASFIGKAATAGARACAESSESERAKIPFVTPNISLESDYKLIQEDSQFKRLLEEKIPDCDEGLERIITVHSRPLRGRYRWSVCYLDDIKNIVKRNKGKDDPRFSEQAANCCRRVYVAAKEGLKSRLEDIDGRTLRELSKISPQSNPDANKALLKEVLERQDQHKKLLDELCWLAVRSDLLGESTIFQSKECAEMVTLGFAFAEKVDGTEIARKIVLKERIAVEAAVEYFQAQRVDGKPSRYDDALKRSFYQEQGNLSALGKKAELFFAWHLKKILQTPGQRMNAVLPAFSRTERMRVLNLLVGQAKNVEELLHERGHGSGTDTRSKLQFGFDLDQLYLIEGAQTAFQEKSHGSRPETMWGWLKMIREGDPDLKSTFWFPSEKAGPDVVFALKGTAIHRDRSFQIIEPGTSGPKKKTEESEEEPGKIDNCIVLCVVQIKRQGANRDIPGAILSTSPNHWFRQGTNSEAKHILQELNEWRKEGHPIVRILVTSLTDPPTDNPKKKQPKEYLQEEMTESPIWEKLNPNYRKTKGKSRKAKGKSRKTTRKPSKLSTNDGSKDFESAGIPLNQQYFNWIGAEHDGDLFGAAFKEFNRADRDV